jgi:hypothetical protein
VDYGGYADVLLSYDLNAESVVSEAPLADQPPFEVVMDSLLTSEGRGLLLVMREGHNGATLRTAVIDAATAATVMEAPFEFDEAAMGRMMPPNIDFVKGAAGGCHVVAKAAMAPLMIWSALPDGPVRRVVEFEQGQMDATSYREYLLGFTASEGEARMLFVHHNIATVRPPCLTAQVWTDSLDEGGRGDPTSFSCHWGC